MPRRRTQTQPGDPSRPTPASRYDVAFSLRYPVLSKAKAIASALAPDFTSFVFDEQQERLAGGGDLAQEFTQVFGRESALNVVMLSDGWGETKWTRFELPRVLNEGWKTVFIIQAERDYPLPPWLPPHWIAFDLQAYGVAQAAGAIRGRLAELGSQSRRESHGERAARMLARERKLLERKARAESASAVAEVETAVQNLFAELTRLANAVAESADAVQIGSDERIWAISRDRQSVFVEWSLRYSNSNRDAKLTMTRFSGPIVPPPKFARSMRGQTVGTSSFEPVLDESDEWAWTEEGRSLRSTSQTAHRIMDAVVEQLFNPPKPPQSRPRHGGGWATNW